MMRSRWMILVVAAVLVVLAMAAAYVVRQAKTAVPEVVQAQRFELVDAEGRVRAVLGQSEYRADPYDDRGELRTVPMPPGSRPLLALYDETGQQRAELSLSANGDPQLQLWDSRGRPSFEELLEAGPLPSARATLCLSSGEPTLSFRGENGTHKVFLTGDKDPTLSLSGEDGRPRAILTLSGGDGTLVLVDERGRLSAGLP